MRRSKSRAAGAENSVAEQNVGPEKMGRRERRAAETRLRLFRCALQLFSERGFFNVTVEDITEAADVGKGTFFNYFESKDYVLGVMAEIQVGKVREALAQAENGKQSVRKVLESLCQRLAEEPGRSPELARTLISSFLASETVRLLVHEHMSIGRKSLAGIFSFGQRSGEIPPRLRSDELAELFQQAVMGTILLWSLKGESNLRHDVARTFEHFWRGITSSGSQEER